MNKWFVFIGMLVLLLLVGLADLALNLFALIPVVGSAFESLSEAGLELLQLIIAAIGGFLLVQAEGS